VRISSAFIIATTVAVLSWALSACSGAPASGADADLPDALVTDADDAGSQDGWDGDSDDAGDKPMDGESDAGGDTIPDDGSDAGDDTGGDDAGGDAGGDADNYRSSLGTCWTDASCPRAMAIGHGGLWDIFSVPYDSNAALAAAFEAGMDGVKIDVRVTADDVPVISHSSPIEIYESLDCSGRRIEEMTAAEVTGCHRLPSTTETFQRLDDVINYLRGKMVVQLCVKLSSDYGRTIDEIHTQAAEDFAFIEVSTADLQNIIPTLPGSDTVYYLIEVGSNMGEIDTLLDTIQNPRAFMYEFDPDAPIGDLVATRLHPGGVRAFTYDSADVATAAHFEGLYESGYDVVSANAGNSVLQARIAINQSRGVDPP